MKNINQKGFTLIEFLIVIAITGIAILFLTGSFVNSDIVYRTMEAQGYSNIEIVDRASFVVGWRGCSSSDSTRFTVRATNIAGKTAEVYVCAGWFKGGTIRVP